MKNKKMLIQWVAFIGVIINIAYGLDLLASFFDPQHSKETTEILISAIALEFGWATLLLWVMFKPLERHYILLITAIPMMLGNILHSVNQYLSDINDTSTIIINLIIGSLFSGLFIFSYLIGNSKSVGIDPLGIKGQRRG